MKNTRNRRIAYATVTAVAIAAVVAVVVLPSHAPRADAAAPPTSRSIPPYGVTAKWGVPFGLLDSACAQGGNRGGWDNAFWNSNGSTTPQAGTGTELTAPIAVELAQPCRAGTTSQPQNLQIAYKLQALTVGSSPPTLGAQMFLGGMDAYSNPGFSTTGEAFSQSLAICATTEWSTSQTSRPGNTRKIVGGYNNGAVTSLTATPSTLWNADTFACPYLVGIDLRLCFLVGNITTTPSAYAECRTVHWTAERWYQQFTQGGAQLSSDPLLVELCAAAATPTPPECLALVVQPPSDPTSFSQVCGSPPALAWGDFSWVAATIGYYSNCLFNPQGGWDRQGVIANSFGSGTTASGQIQTALAGLNTAFAIPETCGAIVDTGTMRVLPHMAINTCDWSWAPPMKTFVTWAVYLLGGFYLLRMVVAVALSFVNRKVINPLDEDAK